MLTLHPVSTVLKFFIDLDLLIQILLVQKKLKSAESELAKIRGEISTDASSSQSSDQMTSLQAEVDNCLRQMSEERERFSAEGEAWVRFISEVLALKHESRILGHSSIHLCGFSMMEQVRLCAVWPM